MANSLLMGPLFVRGEKEEKREGMIPFHQLSEFNPIFELATGGFKLAQLHPFIGAAAHSLKPTGAPNNGTAQK